MPTFFFSTGLITTENNLLRVRAPASPKDRVQLRLKGQEAMEPRPFGPDAAIVALVHADSGRAGDNPFDDTESSVTYDPYIEFIFFGACKLARETVAGKEGLVIESEGSVTLKCMEGAFPFAEEEVRRASFIGVYYDDGLPRDPGPHIPKPSPEA